MGRWKKAIIEEIRSVSPTTNIFKLRIESDEPFSFKAGQFVTFDLPIGEKRLERWRSYSIASAPSTDNIIELCIVKVENGRASNYLFNDVEVGTELKMKGPGVPFVFQSLWINHPFLFVPEQVLRLLPPCYSSFLKKMPLRKRFI